MAYQVGKQIDIFGTLTCQVQKLASPCQCWHIKLNNWHAFGTLARWHHSSTPPPSLFLKGEGLTLPKVSRKGGMEKLLQGKGDSVGKGGDAVSLGIFSSWGVTNVTTMTFNYILVIAFLSSFHVSVSPCFHGTVLLPVYRMYSC